MYSRLIIWGLLQDALADGQVEDWGGDARARLGKAGGDVRELPEVQSPPPIPPSTIEKNQSIE